MGKKRIDPKDLDRLIRSTGVEPETTVHSRRRHPRRVVSGAVTFRRPDDAQTCHGELTDLSEGGLAFLTTESLAVGEVLLIGCHLQEEARTFQARVETVHAHEEERRFLVGCKFLA